MKHISIIVTMGCLLVHKNIYYLVGWAYLLVEFLLYEIDTWTSCSALVLIESFNTSWPVRANYTMRFNDTEWCLWHSLCNNLQKWNHLVQLSFIPKSLFLYKKNREFYFRFYHWQETSGPIWYCLPRCQLGRIIIWEMC